MRDALGASSICSLHLPVQFHAFPVRDDGLGRRPFLDDNTAILRAFIAPLRAFDSSRSFDS